MELFVAQFLLLLRFAAECYVADYIFVFTLRCRDNFSRRLLRSIVVTLVLLLVMAVVCATFPESFLEMADVICFAIILGPVNLGWMAYCFKDSAWNIIFCAVFGLLAKLGAVSIIEAIKLAIPESSYFLFFVRDDALGLLSQYFVILAIYFMVYLVFGRGFERSDGFVRCGKRIIPIYVFAALIIPILALTEIESSEQQVMLRVLLKLCEAAICFLVISVQFSLSREMLYNERKGTVDALFMESQKQYEMLKQSMEIINLKCHDMRHQLRAMESGKIDEAYLAELEKAISIYDSTIKTGNDVLDVILTDKGMRCSAGNIEFTCIADGEKLSFMQQSDIIALFGNALENAMEYESGIVDEEKRFISLTVKEEADVLYIRLENYWCGEEIRWRDGLPVTTKGNTNTHGFGMLSMRNIAEKYGGSLQVKAQDDLFRLIIVIPLK